jgi:hypothetical protein
MTRWLQSSRTRWALGVAVVVLAVFGIVIFIRSPSGVQLNANSPSAGTSPTDTVSASGPGAVTGSSTPASSGASGTATSPATSPSKTTGRSSPGAAGTGQIPKASGSSSAAGQSGGQRPAGSNGPAPASTVPPAVQPDPIPIAVPAGTPIPPGQSTFSTQVVLSGVIGPSTASGFVTTTVGCPPGNVSLGGGVKTVPPPDSGQPSPLHLDGSFPSDASGHPVADGASSTYWTAIVEEGASVDSANGRTRTYVFAICGGGGGALSTIVKVSTVQGPFGASGIVTTTATCPAGTILVGGGANTVPGNQSVGGQQPSPLHLVGSLPSDAAGNPVPRSGASPQSWTASAEEGADTSSANPPISTTTAAFAICASGDAISSSSVVAVTAPGPTTASGYVTATASCPPGTVLLGGGSHANAPPGTGQPSPFHLDGNYPSDGSGNPVTVPSSVDSWSVVSETGAGLPGATTSVYAICGS